MENMDISNKIISCDYHLSSRGSKTLTITSKLIVTNFENVIWFNRNTLAMDLFSHCVQFIFSHFPWLMVGLCVSLCLRNEKSNQKNERKGKN